MTESPLPYTFTKIPAMAGSRSRSNCWRSCSSSIISHYSYLFGQHAYLEEDCDVGVLA